MCYINRLDLDLDLQADPLLRLKENALGLSTLSLLSNRLSLSIRGKDLSLRGRLHAVLCGSQKDLVI